MSTTPGKGNVEAEVKLRVPIDAGGEGHMRMESAAHLITRKEVAPMSQSIEKGGHMIGGDGEADAQGPREGQTDPVVTAPSTLSRSPDQANKMGLSTLVKKKVKHGQDDDDDNFEEKAPFKLDFHLPEEVWEMILDHLTEDKDRTNCCRALPLFDKVLTKSKPHWMFKEILPIMWGHGLGKGDLLTCRSVCKRWCTDFDHHISTKSGFDNAPFKKNTYAFTSVGDIDQFTSKFEGHFRNPFIHRVAYVQSSREDGFQSKILELLSKYGKNLFFLEFTWNGPAVDEYPFIQQIITLTSNLKKLRIWGTYAGNSVTMTENPLPAIPTLLTLGVWPVTDEAELPDSFCSFIDTLVLVNAPHLQSIQISSEISGHVFSHQLPKLEFLEFSGVSKGEDLEKLLLLAAPLKTLMIEGTSPLLEDIASVDSDQEAEDNEEDDVTISITTFIRILKNFPLLEEMGIESCVVGAPLDSSHHFNSSVRKLTLRFWKTSEIPASFEFLCSFKALEKLHIMLPIENCSDLTEDEEEGSSMFCGRLEDNQQLYKSWFWRHVPSLKSVSIIVSQGLQMVRVDGNRKQFDKYEASRLAAGSNLIE